MIKYFKFFHPIVPIIIYILTSCTAEEGLSTVSPGEVRPADVELSQKNALLHDYAIRLAVAVQQKEVRQLIREQALQKFDGDYDVLLKTLDNKSLNGLQCTMGKLLAEVGKKNPALRSICAESDSATSVDALLDDLNSDIQAVIPNAQVSVPVHCEAWDPDNYVPMVAVLPYDYDEDSVTQVVAYDSNGKIHLLNTKEEPDVPVLVVGRSERVDESGNSTADAQMPAVQTFSLPRVQAPLALSSYPSKLTLNHGIARSLMLEWEDVADEKGYEVWRMSGNNFQKIATLDPNENNYMDNNLTPTVKYWYKVRAITADGYSSWSPIMATTASNRTDNEWLKIQRMRFSSSALKAVESWLSGAPEIRLRVVQGSVNGASNVFTSGRLEPNRRGDINDRWWNREVSIFGWSTGVYGTVLTFDWREEDWTDNVDFSLSGSYEDKASGGTVKVGGAIQINNDDGGDVIGNTSVMWWQDKTQIYDLSGFQWQFVY